MTIQVLPPQLANQIAAGEVVERPASVIKELVENSIDAGATRIDIEIDRGGSKRIKITDNGKGIAKEELALALSRHATSKLSELNDLDSILSFGFRGEALASISSVSRLTLTSKTAAQTEAWQAYVEGIDMAARVMPAAHPTGSTVEAVDLFFNTPARRRFLKSDKTEFTHIDEWLKRIAIVRSDIHFTLKHNGKQIRNYRAAKSASQQLQRLAQVCGKRFVEQVIEVDCHHEGLSLTGYVQSPFFEQSAGDIQYFYVNGRLIRDRLVNHAVRQAFAEQGSCESASYILMLTIAPDQVDVNVHPAKHEVRFHQSRYVHDFILQAIQSALYQVNSIRGTQQQGSGTVFDNELREEVSSSYSTKVNDFTLSHIKPAVKHCSANYSQGARQAVSQHYQARSDVTLPSQGEIKSYQQLLQTSPLTQDSQKSDKLREAPVAVTESMPALLDDKYWVLVRGEQLSLLSISQVDKQLFQQQLTVKMAQGLVSQPLLMPISIPLEEDWLITVNEREKLLRKLGVELSHRLDQLIIKKVPPYLRECQLVTVIPELLQWIRPEEPSDQALVKWLAETGRSSNTASQLWEMISELSDGEREAIFALATPLPWQQWCQD